MEEVEVEGLTIAFERRGAGPPLVLLHGGASDHREWRRQLEGLSDAFTVVAWDGPGSGASSDPPESWRLPEHARALVAFIEAVGLERPHLAGLSWGSTLALELYRLRPDLPRSLVLAAAYAGWAGSLSVEEVEGRLSGTLSDLSLPPEEYARRWMPTLFTDRAPAEMIEEQVAIVSDFHPAGARSMVHAMAEADLRGVLPTIAVPTLLVYGAEDVRSPGGVAEDMHAAIPDSTLIVLPKVGHQCNVEAADRFNAVVRDFLDAVEESPGPRTLAAARRTVGGSRRADEERSHG